MKTIQQRDSSAWQALPASWPDCLRKALAARDISSEHDITYTLAELPSPRHMMGMQDAVVLLSEALHKQWRILIVADFDVDGASSCAVAIRGLKAMGAKHVDFIVPNRFIHGYGLTPELLEEIDQDEQPDLLITVDNGIASIAGVEKAQQRGMKVLVTDHHLPGEALPDAEAIVNPNQKGDSFPSKHLAGVGVMFYVLMGLRQHLREQAYFEQTAISEPKLIELVDLVALGTVADVVVLDKLNRTLVNLGLARIRRQMSCVGIRALAQVAAKDISQLSTSDIGFGLAPRLNAAGRMEDMTIGIHTLLTDDFDEAISTANILNDINIERRSVEKDMQEHALQMLDSMSLSETERPLAYCLFDPSWHQGLVGLLASRIKERQHRPVIAFAPGDNGEIKGSARSIAGIHIRDTLALIASQNPRLLSRFGGHAMAAGLTIKQADLPEFKRCLLNVIESQLDPEILNQVITSDGELNHQEITTDIASQLAVAAPWGQGFPEPQFHGRFTISQVRPVGKQADHLRLTIALDSGNVVVAMAFNQQQPAWLKPGGEAILVYRLSVNEYREQRSVQLIVSDLFPVD